MALIVRYAARQDLDRITAIRRMVFDIHSAGKPDVFRPSFSPELQQYAEECMQSNAADLITAELDGVVCGFAIVQYIHRPQTNHTCEWHCCHISEFGVDAAFRRRGVATAMMDFIRSEAKQKGFVRIDLDVWAFNEEARRFYAAYGMKEYRLFL